MRHGRDAGFDRMPEMVMTPLPVILTSFQPSRSSALMMSPLFIAGDTNPDDDLS
jgi:hypothetical protein